MSATESLARISTGVPNLDALCSGGLPRGAMVLFAGPPGSGKTILAQQICFHHAGPERRVLYVSTLSEPTAKVLRYLGDLAFFDATKFRESIRFVDLGAPIQEEGLARASALIVDHVKAWKPTLVVIDSFKVFDDVARSSEDLRKFGYQLAVSLMAWEVTSLILGEYGAEALETNPLFSIVDGVVAFSQREESGERQRFLHVVKMRGSAHSLEAHPFAISRRGVTVYAPNQLHRSAPEAEAPPCLTGIPKLDDLLGGGIPRGTTLLVAGVSGTGKTLLLLETIYRGALAGERGLFVSLEEPRDVLLASARGFGWDLDAQIARGLVELLFVPQTDIRVEAHLALIEEMAVARDIRRLAIDSVSVLLYKVDRPQLARDRIFQLTSLIHDLGAVGFLATDIPYGTKQISRLGVEETVVDGVVLLTSSEEGLERQRYVEIYKLRNGNHLRGRHAMVIGPTGLAVFPRYRAEARPEPPPVETSRRVPTGVPGLDPLLGGGLLERSVTLLAGSSGIGKSTLGLQFVVEGAHRGERGIFFTLEEGPSQLLGSADALGLPLRRAVEEGMVELVHLAHEHVRAPQFLSILADRITSLGARRLVLDGAGHVIAGAAPAEELEHLLHSLVTRFRSLGATGILTIESESLYSADFRSSGGLSPVADNLVLMRYARLAGRLQPLISVVKTRGSEHDWTTHRFSIEQGGVRIEADAAPPMKRQRARPPRRR
jgi:circadian clock protein KaiC